MKDSEFKGLDRRSFLKMAGIAAAGLGLAACAPAATPTAVPAPTKAASAPASSSPAASAPVATTSSAAADADAAAKLYDAAKKEGQVMAYTNGTQQEWDQFGAAFEKKYPGIKVTGFPGTSEQLRDKVSTEIRAGKPVADVIARDAFENLSPYLDMGALDKYVSPEWKNLDPKYVDPNGLYAIGSYYVYVHEYNTKAISKEQAPKSYADMLKPEYKGKLGLEASAFPWFTYMLKIMGQDKGMAYMKALGAQKPRLVSGHTSLHKLIVSGEIPIAVYMYNFRPMPDKEAGAPVEWVDPAETTPAASLLTGVIKNAPHPNAARLMADFMFSEEAAKIIAGQYWIPLRKGFDLGKLADVAKVDMLIVNDPNFYKEIAANEKPFRDIFGQA
ncbi:MAG: extracellular solute-binding protein [Dehalococcoidia bacterium]|nr:extracellular solute-binding protein [Dehalococcoidia bacterium]